ncbi:MAG TPA: hypothetical protein VLH77_06470 [Gammaproteobacteria bacterium]|nr:hypothetical protein [Gammaproteobacteria bacterium]
MWLKKVISLKLLTRMVKSILGIGLRLSPGLRNKVFMKGYTEPQKTALDDVVHLMHRHHLRVDDVGYAFRHALPAEKSTKRLTWVHVFYYLGALCIFSGLISYYTIYWRFISTVALSVTFSLVGAVTFFAGAWLLERVPEASPYRAKRPAYALLLVAAIFQMSGLFMSFDELSVLLKPQTVGMIVFAVLTVTAWIGIKLTHREPFVALSVTYISFFWLYLFDRFDWSENLRDILLGLSLCFLAYYFFNHCKSFFYRIWYIVGSIALQLGIFDAVFRKKTEVLFLLAVGGLLFVSTKLREKTLFLSGTIGLLLYVNTLIYRYLAKSFNVPMLFIIAGFFCIMIGLLLNKWYRQKFPVD